MLTIPVVLYILDIHRSDVLRVLFFPYEIHPSSSPSLSATVLRVLATRVTFHTPQKPPTATLKKTQPAKDSSSDSGSDMDVEMEDPTLLWLQQVVCK